jgi:hypothetical protein
MEGFWMNVGLFLLYCTGLFFATLVSALVVGIALKNRRKANAQKQKSREPIRDMYFMLYGKDGIVEPTYEEVGIIDYTVDREGRIKQTGDEIRQMQGKG